MTIAMYIGLMWLGMLVLMAFYFLGYVNGYKKGAQEMSEYAVKRYREIL